MDGTPSLLQEAQRQHVQRFIHIFSTAVYGIPDHHPLLETDALSAVGPYGKAKIQAEQVGLKFRKQGMILPILRPKTFVGPERLGVFALLYQWALEGRNFPILGSGHNRYQLLDVEDTPAILGCSFWTGCTSRRSIPGLTRRQPGTRLFPLNITHINCCA